MSKLHKDNLKNRIVIIGGGAIGLSTAYHLGKLGCNNVTLLERNELTSGTSWHAAGIVGPLRASQNLTMIAKYALELVEKIEQETGQATGYKQTGGLWVTQSQDRITELKRIAAMGEMNGLHNQFLTPDELKERYPMINTSDLAGAMWLDQDGQINPVDLCMAFAKGARANGVQIREHCGVKAIEVVDRIAKFVVLETGEEIECDIVINCSGLWAREIGLMAGVSIPLHAVEHMYVVTEPIPELPDPWPVCRDMEGALYIKEDTGKLVLGVFEPNAKLWDHTAVDPKASYLTFDEDWSHIEPMLNAAIHRIPRFESIGLTHFMTGPESFTPDTKPLIGKAHEIDNFYVAAGMNSLGIMSSPGVGKVMAAWMVQGYPPVDLWEVDVQRFQPKDNNLDFIRERTIESVSNQFDMHWPNKQFRTGRNRTKSVWHDRMAEQGAVFGSIAGWERPMWFAKDDEPTEMTYSYGDQCWWSVAKRESKVLANSGALFDLSPFTKILIDGPDALCALQRLCTNQMDVPVGKVVYTLMLNARGGIECELTVTRLSADQYLLITASATRIRDLCWIVSNTSEFDIQVTDETDKYSVLGVMGPHSRELMGSLSASNFDNECFAFGASKPIQINNAVVRASRLSFVGELGWELLISNDIAEQVFDEVLSTGSRYDMIMAGFLTMECCRLEKGYLHWGHEVSPEENPYQAKLKFAVKENKADKFIGQDALQNGLNRFSDKQLVLFEAPNSRPLLLHDEPIYLNGKWIGKTTSGGVGFRTEKTLCFGYIDSEYAFDDDDSGCVYQVKVAGEMVALSALSEPPYDPKGVRMRS